MVQASPSYVQGAGHKIRARASSWIGECLIGVGLRRATIERATGRNINGIADRRGVGPVTADRHWGQRAPAVRVGVEHFGLIEDTTQSFPAKDKDLAFQNGRLGSAACRRHKRQLFPFNVLWPDLAHKRWR